MGAPPSIFGACLPVDKGLSCWYTTLSDRYWSISVESGLVRESLSWDESHGLLSSVTLRKTKPHHFLNRGSNEGQRRVRAGAGCLDSRSLCHWSLQLRLRPPGMMVTLSQGHCED